MLYLARVVATCVVAAAGICEDGSCKETPIDLLQSRLSVHSNVRSDLSQDWKAHAPAHTICSEGFGKFAVADQLECQNQAHANGHVYYEYSSDENRFCRTGNVCEVLDSGRVWPWVIYKYEPATPSGYKKFPGTNCHSDGPLLPYDGYDLAAGAAACDADPKCGGFQQITGGKLQFFPSVYDGTNCVQNNWDAYVHTGCGFQAEYKCVDDNDDKPGSIENVTDEAECFQRCASNGVVGACCQFNVNNLKCRHWNDLTVTPTVDVANNPNKKAARIGCVPKDTVVFWNYHSQRVLQVDSAGVVSVPIHNFSSLEEVRNLADSMKWVKEGADAASTIRHRGSSKVFFAGPPAGPPCDHNCEFGNNFGVDDEGTNGGYEQWEFTEVSTETLFGLATPRFKIQNTNSGRKIFAQNSGGVGANSGKVFDDQTWFVIDVRA